MTEVEFKKELGARGFHLVIPEPGSATPWGLIDVGRDVFVNRWNGGNTLEGQLAYAVKMSERVAGSCDATVCSNRWKKREPEPKAAKAAKKASKKAVKKAVKKGAKR
jgi:hypothetical protein